MTSPDHNAAWYPAKPFNEVLKVLIHPDAQTAYIHLRDGTYHHTDDWGHNVHADVDEHGNVLGVEVTHLPGWPE